jgi:hypothetical protein
MKRKSVDAPKKTQDAAKPNDSKIQRFLIPGKPSAQAILNLFEKITGRKATQEEIEEMWDMMKKRESNP